MPKANRWIAIKEWESLPDNFSGSSLKYDWRLWSECDPKDSTETLARMAINRHLRENGLGTEPRTFHIFVKNCERATECQVHVFLMTPTDRQNPLGIPLY